MFWDFFLCCTLCNTCHKPPEFCGLGSNLVIPTFLPVSSHRPSLFCEPALSGSMEETFAIAAVFTVMNMNSLLLAYLKLCSDFRTKAIKPPEEEVEIKQMLLLHLVECHFWAWPTNTNRWECCRWPAAVIGFQDVKCYFPRTLCRVHPGAAAVEHPHESSPQSGEAHGHHCLAAHYPQLLPVNSWPV